METLHSPSRQWLRDALQNDKRELLDAVRRVHNCRYVTVSGSGRIWIANPQRAHWLDDDAVEHTVTMIQKGA
jgi:hypothetical protein